MRYVMRQKLFSFGDDFTVRDDEGRDVYQVKSRLLSLGNKLSFQDMAGNEVAFIAQRLLAWGPTYEITRDGRVAAEVRKDLFTFFRCTYTVDVPGPGDLHAVGGVTEHEYRFEREGRAVATVSKRWFSWSDTYGVEVADGEDDVLILAATVVIDMACHPDEED